MAGFSYSNNEHLVRTLIWSKQLKETLLDELLGMRYVRMLSEFTDGDTINIPSIGQFETLDYLEGNPVQYTAADTGNFTFTIDQYKSSATYITEKMKQDSYYMSELMASFIPKQNRALMKAIEVKILDVAPTSQTASNPNVINAADHRFVASGGVDGSRTILPIDFAKAKYALQKANVPMEGLTALIDPSLEYQLSTLTNIVNVSNNPRWEGIIKSGMSTGMRFVTNIYGFDCYVSQNLKVTGAETIAGTNSGGTRISGASATANLFFSAASDVLPWIGNIRQAPKVDSGYNKDLQREEYVTTCRYGFKIFRPENLVTVLVDPVIA